MDNPFNVFHNWLMDYKPDSPFPEQLEKSPVNHMYVLSLFCLIPELTVYLNETFNNFSIWYLTKKDLFLFLKKCILDLKIPRSKLKYFKVKKLDKIYKVMLEKFPHLKMYDVDIILENIDDLKNFYIQIGLDKEKIKKEKIKKIKQKTKPTLKKYSMDELMKNFEYVEV